MSKAADAKAIIDLLVLAGLGELRHRPPVVAMEGPNLLARQRGRAFLRRAFGTAP